MVYDVLKYVGVLWN